MPCLMHKRRIRAHTHDLSILLLELIIEQLRQAGENIYAFELKATRQDIGEVIDQASDLIGTSAESSSAS